MVAWWLTLAVCARAGAANAEIPREGGCMATPHEYALEATLAARSAVPVRS